MGHARSLEAKVAQITELTRYVDKLKREASRNDGHGGTVNSARASYRSRAEVSVRSRGDDLQAKVSALKRELHDLKRVTRSLLEKEKAEVAKLAHETAKKLALSF